MFNDIRWSVLVGVVIGIVYLLFSVNEGWPHVHWINKGKYLDGTTGTHCCNENDCKVMTDAEIETVRILPDGGALVGGTWFKPEQLHYSEDGLWYRCVNRCVFRPSGV